MRIFNFLKKIVNRINGKKKNELLLDLPENAYKDLIDHEKIEKIISNMPQNLSQIEKAYYIYIELGKIVKESTIFVFGDRKGREEHYDDSIDNSYYGICKSISELYVSILRDKRIGISADLVKENPDSQITHIDTILKIDGKKYIVNLIGDLSRIKTFRRVNCFCFDLNRNPDNIEYLNRLKQYYGRITSLTREEIEQLDKKLGYSFFIPKFSKQSERGIYTEDTIELLRKDLENPEKFRKYVLHNEDVPEELLLQYKLDYVFQNIHKLTEFNGNMGFLENIRYYQKIAEKLLSPREASRIQSYVAAVGNDLTNILSILKVKLLNQSNDNIYYLYSTEAKQYIRKTPEEMKEFIDGLDKEELHIVGTYDRFNPRGIDELEL